VIPRFPAVTVVGAGTMGAQLACLIAGAGSRVTLLDVDAETAAKGLDRATRIKPAPLYTAADLARIATDGLDGLEASVATADWVIEAIVEQAGPKHELLARIDAALPADGDRPIVTTNTSGLSIAELADGRSERFRRRFFGSHFFNPPRYARLLELVPHAGTDRERMAELAAYASRHLGKGTVVAHDTPAFIANRLGVHGLLATLRLALELGLGPDEVDELTGELLGRPKSATFRTLDLVGIDVALAVADHCHTALGDDPERAAFDPPAVMRGLVERGDLGAKTGVGFFRREPDGEILALDFETGEYRPRRRVSSRTVEAARAEADLSRRLAILLAAAGRDDDPAGAFLGRLLAGELRYAAGVAPQLADDAWSVDAAMRWGFGWTLGPLETLDTLGDAGTALVAEGDGAAAAPPPPYYRDGRAWDFRQLALEPPPTAPPPIDLGAARSAGAASGLPSNASASIVELPDDILGVELHGKLNIIGLDTMDVLLRAVDLASERYDGLVVGTAAPDFSAGANLVLLVVEAEDGEWDELDRAVRRFQAVTTALRYAPVPTVVAPRGRTLGGGAELMLSPARVQALAETYVGLVEVGVGLVPAGGGSVAMARRAAASVPPGTGADVFPAFQHVFMSIATARVATSAAEARELWLLGEADRITADPDRQWLDAAQLARTLADGGYRPPARTPFPVLGRRGIAAAEALTYNELSARRMSEHDRRIVLELARVMSGGDVAESTLVGEDHLLDLEREAFLRLLGERLTRDRMRHMLKTGKPLRN
jgi:3-hydroxyacyl-CoA dehydrogenase